MNDKARRLFHWLLTGAAAAVCALFSLPCAAVLILFSGLLFGLYEAQLYKRRQTAKRLCDEIDRILRGEDRIDFDEYREGELSVLAAEIHKMTVRLREQNAALRKEKQFAKEALEDISHQLRTPLTNIRSYAETLSENAGDVPPATEKKFLGVILNESDRMTHIVQDLLTLSRFDSGRSELKLTRFAFTGAINDLYNATYMEAQRHDHTVELRLEPELGEIVADRERIQQVMMNVVSNSIKYTPDGGHIVISAGRLPGRVWMEVSDNGIGIPKADRERIFERFYRVDKARSRESGGTGLGLSIAKEIMDRHEGYIGIVDREGPGLTVRLELKIEGPGHGK